MTDIFPLHDSPAASDRGASDPPEAVPGGFFQAKSPSQTTRNDAFDWVRTFAALGVVALHASVPYLIRPMPGLVWPVRESGSQLVDMLFWSIELVIMPTFLIMAGFFAWQTLRRKGPRELLQSRSKRLLKPLLFGVIVILPLDLYIWVFGFVCEGWVPPVKLRSLKLADYIAKDLWGFGHLWFLHYLWSYVAILAGGSWWAGRFLTRDTAANRSDVPEQRYHRVQQYHRVLAWLRNSLRRLADAWTLQSTMILIFLMGALVLTLRPEVIWGFQHRIWPVPTKWLYNGLFFVAGASIGHFDPKMVRWAAISRPVVAGTACIMFFALILGQWWLDQSSTDWVWPRIDLSDSVPDTRRATDSATDLAAFSPLAKFTLALATSASSLLGSLVLISIALRMDRKLNRPAPLAIKYFAAASFWVYLLHHPLLGLIHIDLRWLGDSLSPLAKMVLATTLAIGISLITYERFIRQSALGHWLGFAWEIPGKERPARSIPIRKQPEVSRHENEGETVHTLPHDHSSPRTTPRRAA